MRATFRDAPEKEIGIMLRRTVVICSLVFLASALVGMALDAVAGPLQPQDTLAFTTLCVVLTHGVAASLPQSYPFRNRFLAPLTMPIGMTVTLAVTVPLVALVGNVVWDGLEATLCNGTSWVLAGMLLVGLAVTVARPQGRRETLIVHGISAATMAFAFVVVRAHGPAWAAYGVATLGTIASFIIAFRAMPPCSDCACAAE